MSKLGDTHNFGQSVQLDNNWVRKPRPLFWEWLFLSGNSQLRQQTKRLAESNDDTDPFLYFPDLKFEFDKNSRLNSSGKVEFCNLIKPEKLKQEELEQGFGQCLATAFFWGISDLHFENIVFSYSKETHRSMVFPIDIETIFYKQNLLSQTSMLKSVKNNFKNVGAKYLLNLNLNVAQIVNSFLNAIDFFHKYSQELYLALKMQPLNEYPVRCILKPTYIYFSYLKDKENPKQFFDTELEQLERGDIPYFYTHLGSNQIFYLGENHPTLFNQPWASAFGRDTMTPPVLERIIIPKENENILHSALQIARTFDSNKNKKYLTRESTIEYKNDEIYLHSRGNIKLKCKRLK